MFNLLLSFFYFKTIDIAAWRSKARWPVRLFADCGAFSALTHNQVIKVEAYADWLLKNDGQFSVYPNLDVKGNWRQSQANQRYLEGRGLKPIPVYHAAEPWELLDEMCAQYDYVAIGGVAGSLNRNAALIRFFDKCFQVAAGRAVFHGFGVTSWEMLCEFPYYSVDSSSWMIGPRYGALTIFDPIRAKWVKLQLSSRSQVYRHAALIRHYGFDPGQLYEEVRAPDKERRNRIKAITALSYLEAQYWLRKRHGPVICSNGEGLLLYLADASDEHVISCMPSMRLEHADSRLFQFAR